MSTTKIELNLKGINELMKGAEVQAELGRHATEMTVRCGEGYGSRVHLANWVAIANVYAETDEAKRDNIENNTLLKAVSG